MSAQSTSRRAAFLTGASLLLPAVLFVAPVAAQTASPQSSADTCPDGTALTPGQPCLPQTGAQGSALPTDPAAESRQEGQAPQDEVVVTGSRIARPELESVSPVSVLDSKAIETRGFSTLGQALNELPSFGVPGASPIGAGQSSFGPGQSFVDFLGLGSQRTLTLVNSRRFVSSNTASIFGPTGSGGNQVDLNVIPTKLIDRVEQVAAIGAPIYGSDAIAGTINVILKRNYEGVDLDAQYALTSRGDAPDYRFRVLAGRNFAGGRGNITVSGEYNKAKGLVYRDRSLLSTGDFFAAPNDPNSPFTQVITRDRRIPSISPFGIPLVGGAEFGLDISLSPGQNENLVFGDPSQNFGVGPGLGFPTNGTQLRFDANGNLIPIVFGTATALPTDFVIDFSGGNGFSLVDVSNLLTDSERYNANILGSFEITENLRIFGEGWYSSSKGINAVAQPVYNSGLFDSAGTRDGNLIVSINNPFLSAAARQTILNSINNNPNSDQNYGLTPTGGPQDYFYLGRANTDLYSGQSVGRVEVIRGVLGVDGTVNVLPGRDWRFEAFANYGRSRTTGRVPELNQQNFLNALNSVRDASGNIVCAPGATNSPIATVSSTCAPFNPFGQQNSQAVRDYVTTIANPRSLNEQYDFVASVSGPLVKLPGGNLSFALGYEHRDESQKFDPGAFYFGGADPDPTSDANGDGDPTNDRSSFGRSVPIDAVSGRYNTDEIFGELNADIISADQSIPLIRSFSIQSAGRYVMNSIAGNDFTWTAGARLQPIRDITFRGAYTRAIRAPAITEAFNPSSSAFIFATDPCDQRNRGSGPNPTARAANCAAAGLPANFSSLSASRSFPGIVVGNANLGNEKSDSYTIGAIIQPRFIRNLTITVDYVDITLKDVISQFSPEQVLNACYDSSDFPNNQFCANISRDNAGQLDNVTTSYFNSAELRAKAILANADLRVATPFLGAESRLTFNVNYQYSDTLSSRASATDAPTRLNGSIGYSTHKGIGSVGYENGPFAGQVQVAYIGPAEFDRNVPENFREFDGVGDVAFVNLSASYNIGEQFTLRGTVDNVFDTNPPFPSPVGGGVTTYFRGIIGRVFRIGAAVHF